MIKDAPALLRPARFDDLEAILGIYNEAIETTTAIYEYACFDNTYMQHWWQQKTDNAQPVIVAEVDGMVVGFATYGVFRARAAYRTTMEHSVYVLGAFRGRGLGKSLLEDIIGRAKSAGVHVLIGGIDAENELSIQLHEKLGFRRAGRLHEVAFKFNRWLDLVFVELIL
jgi:phosphinothricin acetyltransferase